MPGENVAQTVTSRAKTATMNIGLHGSMTGISKIRERFVTLLELVQWNKQMITFRSQTDKLMSYAVDAALHNGLKDHCSNVSLGIQ